MEDILGSKRRDKVTGFLGTVTCIAKYLVGETRYELEGLDAHGSPRSMWVEANRTEPT